MVKAAVFVVAEAWRHARGPLLVVVLVNLVLALTPAAQVWMVGWLVRVSEDGPGHYGPPLIGLVALVAIGQTMGRIAAMTLERMRLPLQAHFADALLRTVATMSPRQLASAEVTAQVAAARAATRPISAVIGSVVAILAAAVTAVSLCVAVWTISPVAGVLVMASLLPGLLVARRQATVWQEVWKRSAGWDRRCDYTVEQLVTQRTGTELISLGSATAVAEIADRHRMRADGHLDRGLRRLVRGHVAGAAVSAVVLGAALLAILLRGAGGAGVAAGIIGVLGGVVAVRAAGHVIGDVVTAAPLIAQHRDLVASTAPTSSHERTIGRTSATVQTVAVDDLTVSYPGRATPAVSGVCFHVDKGEMVALVGVNGAGKTTTVNALQGMLDLDSGSVVVDGTDIALVPTSERLAIFGPLTQEFGRYEFTVRDSVRLGRPDGIATDAEIWDALERVHMADVVRSTPQGLDTQLGEQFGGVGLSGGQWQRIALARVHLRGADVWILDEPTSAIDAEAEQEIFAELARTKDERITIVVSHRAWTLKDMDRIHVFDAGRIVESGTYEDLIDAGGRFSEIFAQQR